LGGPSGRDILVHPGVCSQREPPVPMWAVARDCANHIPLRRRSQHRSSRLGSWPCSTPDNHGALLPPAPSSRGQLRANSACGQPGVDLHRRDTTGHLSAAKGKSPGLLFEIAAHGSPLVHRAPSEAVMALRLNSYRDVTQTPATTPLAFLVARAAKVLLFARDPAARLSRKSGRAADCYGVPCPAVHCCCVRLPVSCDYSYLHQLCFSAAARSTRRRCCCSSINLPPVLNRRAPKRLPHLADHKPSWAITTRSL
jgi:hypothetical protein